MRSRSQVNADSYSIAENATPAELSNLSEQIMGILDVSDVAFVDEHNRIQDSTTLTENRPYQVAIGAAHPTSAKRLSNTLRDTEHMMIFVRHQNEIDFLQFDYGLATRTVPTHK
jgi:hypothetical protein